MNPWLPLFLTILADSYEDHEISSTQDLLMINETDLKASRLKLLQASLPWPVLADEPQGFALLFQANQAILNPTVWERWLLDAYAFIHASNLETASVPPNESKILRTYIHNAFFLTEESIKQALPPLMQDSIVPRPQPCRWGPTNPCTYRLFEHALESFPEAGYFYLVSHNTLPLKSFEFMYNAFLKDKRIRARLSYLTFAGDGNAMPKSSLWKGLPREAVTLLVLNKLQWVPGQWTWSPFRNSVTAAPDEWELFKPLYNAWKEDMFDKINDGGRWTEHTHEQAWIRDFWQDEDGCIGCQARGAGRPMDLKLANGTEIISLFENPHAWFLRKADDRTLVFFGDSKVPIYEFITDHLLYNSTASLGKVILETPEYVEKSRIPSTRRWSGWKKYLDSLYKMDEKLIGLIEDKRTLMKIVLDQTNEFKKAKK